MVRRWLLVLAGILSLGVQTGWGQAGDVPDTTDMFAELRQVSAQLLVKGLMNRSRTYALDFQFDKAIADMDAAIALDPDNPLLYVERGQRILLLYEWDRVLADYDKAIELDPTYADAYYYRGILFYTQGPRDQASLDFERYLELAPEGEHAENALEYIESIRIELEALNG